MESERQKGMDELLLPDGWLVCHSRKRHNGGYIMLRSVNTRRDITTRQRHHWLDISRGLLTFVDVSTLQGTWDSEWVRSRGPGHQKSM
jgi:hypothetical protein